MSKLQDTALCMIDRTLDELMLAFTKSNKVEDLCAWLMKACPKSQVEFVKVMTLDGSTISLDGRSSDAYRATKKLIQLDERSTHKN